MWLSAGSLSLTDRNSQVWRRCEANEEKNVTVEVTKELVNECISNVSYFNSLDQNTKYSVRDYVSNKGGFMPLHIRNI